MENSEIVTRQDAQHAIARKLSDARDLIEQAEELAIAHDTSFSFDLCYGAGARFTGDREDGENGWCASSQSC